MRPRIQDIEKKQLVGMSDMMLLSEQSKIGELWRRFMPQKQHIINPINDLHFSIQVYQDSGFDKAFHIWAAIEVSEITEIPKNMSSIIILKGNYAIFTLKGMNIGKLYENIMSSWLPSSGYLIDNRPHFQVMDERYKNGSPDSEEDVYIPISKAL